VTGVVVSCGGVDRRTAYEYDAMGRRVRAEAPDGSVTTYEYEPTGELRSQGGGRVYPVSYRYDPRAGCRRCPRTGAGRAAIPIRPRGSTSAARLADGKTFADGSSTRFEYHPDGALRRRTWARGATADYVYDAAGSLTNISYSDGTPRVAHRRDRLGRPIAIADAMGTWTNVYQADGQLDVVTVPHVERSVLDYDYDSSGRRASVAIRDPAAGMLYQVSYAFDAAGRFIAVSNGPRLPAMLTLRTAGLSRA